MRDIARVLAAAADPHRLAMLGLLSRQGQLCVCDIQAVLGISQSSASRHLRTLREAGLLEDERVGSWVHYRIPPRPGRAQAAILAAIEGLLGPEHLAALDDKARERRRGTCLPGAPAEVGP